MNKYIVCTLLSIQFLTACGLEAQKGGVPPAVSSLSCVNGTDQNMGQCLKTPIGDKCSREIWYVKSTVSNDAQPWTEFRGYCK